MQLVRADIAPNARFRQRDLPSLGPGRMLLIMRIYSDNDKGCLRIPNVVYTPSKDECAANFVTTMDACE